ncbi:unnamed protein product [Angiostrongylus costaricensis]|uniref:Cytochrome P450 n=1 Tax=Angiostrongylus costaricensis TaxID=334426 RepID=A0A158PLR9_ANGCS|nr:unnamed protein product [Angiostrongylus costaricensis]
MGLLALIVIFIVYVVFVYRRQLVQLWRLNRHCSAAFVKVPGPPCLPVIGAAHLFKWNDLAPKEEKSEVNDGFQVLVDLIAEEKGFFDLFPYIKRCALDIICETAMGTAINSQTNGNSEYVLAVQRLTSILWKYQRFPWLWLKPIWYLSGIGFEFNRLVKLTNDFTRKVIAERKRSMKERKLSEDTEGNLNKKKLAFLDLLLHMQHSNELTDEDIREEVDTFMFEGHDTTSSGIGFTVWWLGQMPECQKKVHEELDSVFGDSDRLPTQEDLKKLVYLEKCIKESLRLTPSVPLVARKLSNNVLIGQKFAVLEEKAVLSWIFRRYHVETEEPFPENYPIPQLVLTPLNGIRVRLTKR